MTTIACLNICYIALCNWSFDSLSLFPWVDDLRIAVSGYTRPRIPLQWPLGELLALVVNVTSCSKTLDPVKVNFHNVYSLLLLPFWLTCATILLSSLFQDISFSTYYPGFWPVYMTVTTWVDKQILYSDTRTSTQHNQVGPHLLALQQKKLTWRYSMTG